MAVASAAATGTSTITPPTSSHGENHHWGYDQYNSYDHDDARYAGQQKNGSLDYPRENYNTGYSTKTRKNASMDNLRDARWDSHDPNVMSPPMGTNEDGSMPMDVGQREKINDVRRRAAQQLDIDPDDEHSKWIHRDKLAKIESQELQAAGIFLPKTRASSRPPRRDRSQSRLRRGTDASEQSHNRSRKNSVAVEQRSPDLSPPIWDLRTPEEIAEEQSNAYFTQAGKGGSRIPVAKTSPAPIPSDYLERSNLAARRQADSPEDETILYPKTRSRSASASLREGDLPDFSGPRKSSAPETSPKKNSGPRKASGPKAATGRPKTGNRGRDSSNNSSTRPSTRSGELTSPKQPEGDPPWMINAYKPDPRLPPDQQLLPTVARRLQQEKWEKEGKFGDVYDKDFRPLNDNVYHRPAGLDKPEAAPDGDKQEDEEPAQNSWPLKPEMPKGPIRQGSYSTMPKITDSPLASPRLPTSPQLQNTQFQSTHIPTPQVQTSEPPAPAPEPAVNEKVEKDRGCCCVMM